MDKPLPDDFNPYTDQGGMQINGEIPQSTLWVAGALWTVLRDQDKRITILEARR